MSEWQLGTRDMNPWPMLLPAAAAGVAAWAAVHPTSELFGPAIHHTPKPSAIALTFDDGPNPACTPQLLRILERHGVAATFFLVGRFARACPDLVREIADRGHAIGNHTERHRNLVWTPTWRITEEINACQESIFCALRCGAECLPISMRPPFGYRGPQLWSAGRSAGLRAVAMWSLTSYDWKHHSAERLIERLRVVERRSGIRAQAETSSASKPAEEQGSASHVQRRRKRGEIVLLHDGDFRRLGADRLHLLDALAFWLPRWRDEGFEFVTMNQLAAAPKAIERQGPDE